MLHLSAEVRRQGLSPGGHCASSFAAPCAELFPATFDLNHVFAVRPQAKKPSSFFATSLGFLGVVPPRLWGRRKLRRRLLPSRSSSCWRCPLSPGRWCYTPTLSLRWMCSSVLTEGPLVGWGKGNPKVESRKVSPVLNWTQRHEKVGAGLSCTSPLIP